MKQAGMMWLLGIFLVAGCILYIGLNTSSAMALDDSNCLACHGKEGLKLSNSEGEEVELYVNLELKNTSAHRYIDCTTCHTTEPHDIESPLNKLSLAEKCGTCHEYEYELHAESVHGQQLRNDNQDVATCVDCHSPDANPHDVIRVLDYTSPAYKKNISETCAKCHNDPELMANYGIVETVYESYMRSFHGKAIALGTYEITQLDEATCTNCHGVHDIMSTSNPSSPVAGITNLAATCAECHTGADEEFASSFIGHREASPNNIPVAYYVEKFFTIFLITVLAFGVIMVIFAIYRFTSDRWRE